MMQNVHQTWKLSTLGIPANYKQPLYANKAYVTNGFNSAVTREVQTEACD